MSDTKPKSWYPPLPVELKSYVGATTTTMGQPQTTVTTWTRHELARRRELRREKGGLVWFDL